MILIVDNDPTFLLKAQEILNRERRVFLASNSRKAYKLAQDLGFSVVLVDLDFKDDDGTAVSRKIHESMPRLPIIAIADNLQEATLELAKELGVVELLSKAHHRRVEAGSRAGTGITGACIAACYSGSNPKCRNASRWINLVARSRGGRSCLS